MRVKGETITRRIFKENYTMVQEECRDRFALHDVPKEKESQEKEIVAKCPKSV